MTTIIVAALMGAFALAFAVRVIKGLVEMIYGLAPYVVFVVGLVGLLVYLEQHVPEEPSTPAPQQEVSDVD